MLEDKMKKSVLFLIFLTVFAAACSKSGSSSPCDGVDCSGHGVCDDSSGRATCLCDEGYVPTGDLTCKSPCESGDCEQTCEEWESYANGECHAKEGRCSKNEDCKSNECNMETHYCEYTGACKGVTCNYHGECVESSGYGSGYGSGSSYQSDGACGITCNCSEGYRLEVGENCVPTCIDENCPAESECGENAFCDGVDENGKEICECKDGFDKNENGECVAGITCSLTCGAGTCEFKDESMTDEYCKCPESYINEGGDEKEPCIKDKCYDVVCEDWEECSQDDGECYVAPSRCNADKDCEEDKACDFEEHTCGENFCKDVNCGNGGKCSVKGEKPVCNCGHGYYDNNTSCVEITSQKPGWVGVQWPFSITKVKDDKNPETVYGQIWVDGQTGTGVSQHSDWKAQLLYKKGTGSAEYPVIADSWHQIDAPFHPQHTGDNNHEYKADFPTDKHGNFIYIFRFSLDNGKTWWYGDKGIAENTEPGPRFIESATNYPGKAKINKNFLTRTNNAYEFSFQYTGTAAIDFAKSIITLNGVETTDYSYDETTKTFSIKQENLEPNKYSWLFRLVDEDGNETEPFFVPVWIGEGIDYADFGWRDAFIYQIMTDRFLNGDTKNDVPESEFPHVTQDLEKWKGGDFAGIIKKLRDGYFTDMGVNALWISAPVLNPHYESKGGTSSSQNNTYFTSYHAYHPLATGYSFDDDYGYDNEGVDPAFGTADELRELIKEAHKQGIRVIPDLVVNHTYIDAEIYKRHPGWFNHENSCAEQGWNDAVIKTCWFTPYMPDFDYNNADARKAVIDHAIWLIQHFDFDGFRADALKHIEDVFVKELRSAVKEKIETTVKNHDMPDEAEVFYMVGESLGDDWPRYHTRADMVQGQVNEQFYYMAKNAILKGTSYNTLAYDVTNDWDRAYLTEKDTYKPAGGRGGFPGAVMGNFFGNHDQDRALTECGGDYTRLQHAQTFLLTSPINIPMLYQGDDIGMEGQQKDGFDGGRRAVMKFDDLSQKEKDALEHVQRLGKFRKEHPALRYGTRLTCGNSENAWVYKLKCSASDNERCKNGDTVIVGINKGNDDFQANCGESGDFYSYDERDQTKHSGGNVTVEAGKSLVIGK